MTSYLIGLIGAGIGPSLSPALHEHEADHHGLRYLYRRLELTAPIGDLIRATRLARYDGLNVTHPVKQTVIAHLDALSPDAAHLGAVNTVLFRDGRAIGHNTDWTGFAESFRRGLPGAAMRHVVQLGAGGAGAAVAHALLTLGAERVTVVDVDTTRATELTTRLNTPTDNVTAGNLDPTRLEAATEGVTPGDVDSAQATDATARMNTSADEPHLAEHETVEDTRLHTPIDQTSFDAGRERRAAHLGQAGVTARAGLSGFAAGPGRLRAASPTDLPALMADADGLVNVTPVGMAAHPGLPLDPGLLRADLWVADVVYRPLETALLEHARRLGCRTLDGSGMVVFQAAGSFRLFTGVEPDVERMLAHLARLI
ncbi:shikimate dehydrogenase [Herbidospora daliensis]|uniref:shikimate dehydrogenase n=1 Tax=Herbidospora daliensis TaxID=295585 RepID=UPI0009FDF110|nr:shikimate dehydrogenase [Herbidospora daliensis]